MLDRAVGVIMKEEVWKDIRICGGFLSVYIKEGGDRMVIEMLVTTSKRMSKISPQ